ncbi:hypothetical protein [Bacillus xiapuensis]|uniref:hypothetical protein n=1 Tax=Bacillus xiapuensis TaxID=2014075 RepID=UPI000C24F14B|nr:hypothetical protein [Bacillus xiapuensis]
MDDKTKIIIKEILFWKENHMLPEQYCDYLLALYRQGEERPEMHAKEKPSRRMALASFFVSLAVLLISVFVLYCTELSIPLQTAILAIFVALLLGGGIYFLKKGILIPIFYVAAAILLLVCSVELHDRINGSGGFSLYALLFANCVLWWGAGKKLDLIYFTNSSWVGAFLLLIFIFI